MRYVVSVLMVSFMMFTGFMVSSSVAATTSAPPQYYEIVPVSPPAPSTPSDETSITISPSSIFGLFHHFYRHVPVIVLKKPHRPVCTEKQVGTGIFGEPIWVTTCK